MDYQSFKERKRSLEYRQGFEPVFIPDTLFEFQKFLADWSIRQGRGAEFLDCGMGKTILQLVWAENVYRHTNKNVLIVAPLAVTQQTKREAEKFGLDVSISRDGKIKPGLTITNYERLGYFDPKDFAGTVGDESSILKSFKGVTRGVVTDFMRKLPYRLLCTATAAPNDFIELGTSSEALGFMGYTDMLRQFFINAENNIGTSRTYGKKRDWRFKGHSQEPFWRYMAGWARAMRKPSDFGFDDDGFVLPELVENSHIVKARTLRDGFLFEMSASDMREEREDEKRTVKERCEMAASLAQTKEPCVIWVNRNDEGDLLETMLPDFVQISGKKKESDLQLREEQFEAFAAGQIRGIIIKPKIGAFGLNWQHCAHTITFPTYSYEQDYQMVRRFWRFGQKRPVRVDRISTESIAHIQDALKRKAAQMDQMFTALVQYMNQALSINKKEYNQKEELPSWLS